MLLLAPAAVAQTKENFSLKGIPIGKPNVVADLKKICTVSRMYLDIERRAKLKIYCDFSGGRLTPVSSPQFEFLGVKGSAAFLIEEAAFEFQAKTEDWDELFRLMQARYGIGLGFTQVVVPNADKTSPSVKSVKWMNEWRWRDRGGNRLTLDTGGKLKMEPAATANLRELAENLLATQARGAPR